jgi:glycerol kinase
MDSWLIAKLTGGSAHVTDHTNASRTLLYGLEHHRWEPDLLDLFGIPEAILPGIVASSGVVGECDPLHFGHRLPIAGIAGDQQAALFGQGCVRAGMAKNTYGTGAFLLSYAGAERPAAGAGLLTTIAAGPRGEPAYALEGSVFIAGAAVQWLRDGLGIIGTAAETEALARSVSDTGGVHFVPAFVGLGSPHWEAEARGTITGLTRGTSRAQLVRAALEAMAYGSADLLDAMSVGQGSRLELLRVDGGAAANDWLMAFQADILGAPIERPSEVETTVVGAVALAGLALGVWPSLDECLRTHTFTRFEPTLAPADRERLREGWRRAVRAALSWARDH